METVGRMHYALNPSALNPQPQRALRHRSELQAVGAAMRVQILETESVGMPFWDLGTEFSGCEFGV